MTQRQAVLLCEDDMPRSDRGNGATTTLLVNRSYGSQSMINIITTIPPRGAIPPHYRNFGETVLVLSGTGISVVSEFELAGKKGDVTWTPNNLPHQFRNRLDIGSMRIFWSSVSAEAIRIMSETGESHHIDAEHKA